MNSRIWLHAEGMAGTTLWATHSWPSRRLTPAHLFAPSCPAGYIKRYDNLRLLSTYKGQTFASFPSPDRSGRPLCALAVISSASFVKRSSLLEACFNLPILLVPYKLDCRSGGASPVLNSPPTRLRRRSSSLCALYSVVYVDCQHPSRICTAWSALGTAPRAQDERPQRPHAGCQ